MIKIMLLLKLINSRNHQKITINYEHMKFSYENGNETVIVFEKGLSVTVLETMLEIESLIKEEK